MLLLLIWHILIYFLVMNRSSLANETVEEKISFSVAFLIILLVAVTGNSFVIHVARKLLSAGRGPFNILVITMAASDILYALTVVPNQVHFVLKGPLWIPGDFGIFLCKFVQFSVVFAISSSILTLTAMTVDRYLAIVPDIKTPLTRKSVLKVIFAILVFSFGWSSIALYKMNTVSHVYSEEKLNFCSQVYSEDKHVDKKLHKAEYTLSFIFYYVFPVVVMSVLYFFIIRFLWLRKIPGNRINQNETQRRKQLRKVTCMLVTMATSFAITLFPVHVTHYYWAYDNVSKLPSFLQHLLLWSAHTNCATNPCFYLIFIKEYQDELRRFYCCYKSSQGKNREQDINLQRVKARY